MVVFRTQSTWSDRSLDPLGRLSRQSCGCRDPSTRGAFLGGRFEIPGTPSMLTAVRCPPHSFILSFIRFSTDFCANVSSLQMVRRSERQKRKCEMVVKESRKVPLTSPLVGLSNSESTNLKQSERDRAALAGSRVSGPVCDRYSLNVRLRPNPPTEEVFGKGPMSSASHAGWKEKEKTRVRGRRKEGEQVS